MATTRTDERKVFLSDVLITFVENYGALSWFGTDVYTVNDDGFATRAVIVDDDDQRHEVNLDTIAHGIGIIRNAVMRVDAKYPQDGEVLHNAETGERLHLSRDERDQILCADRDYDEAVNLDSVDASAIVECALFGKVVYA
jgi:hypothetical protein